MKKSQIDKLVAEASQADIHELRIILFDVFMEGVQFAREHMRKQNLKLRKECALRAHKLFDSAAPEEEHEKRVKKYIRKK